MQKEKIQVILLSSAPRFLDEAAIQTKNLQNTAIKVEKFILVTFCKTNFNIYNNESIHFISVPRMASLLYIFKIKKEINKILDKDIKTIITTGNPFDLGLIGILFKFLFRFPLNIQVHINIFSPHFRKNKKRHFLYYLLSFFTLPFADSIRTVGNEVTSILEDKYKNKLIQNIPEMLNTEIENSNTDTSLETKDFSKNIKFLCVARYDRQKNIKNLLRAFIDFNKKYPNTQLKLVGEGPLKEEFENLIDNQTMKNNISINKWSNNIKEEYINTDFCILTSTYEGFGMVIVESMKYGKPFLATPFGGATYLIKEGLNGFLSEDFSEESIYKLLEKAYINKDNFNSEAIRESVKDLTKENMDKQLIELWKNTN